jgi:hypothetical protein
VSKDFISTHSLSIHFEDRDEDCSQLKVPSSPYSLCSCGAMLLGNLRFWSPSSGFLGLLGVDLRLPGASGCGPKASGCGALTSWVMVGSGCRPKPSGELEGCACGPKPSGGLKIDDFQGVSVGWQEQGCHTSLINQDFSFIRSSNQYFWRQGLNTVSVGDRHRQRSVVWFNRHDR